MSIDVEQLMREQASLRRRIEDLEREMGREPGEDYDSSDSSEPSSYNPSDVYACHDTSDGRGLEPARRSRQRSRYADTPSEPSLPTYSKSEHESMGSGFPGGKRLRDLPPGDARVVEHARAKYRAATRPVRFAHGLGMGQGHTFGSDKADYASSRKISGSDPLQLANMTITGFRRHRGD
jgi:hypothetical protein